MMKKLLLHVLIFFLPLAVMAEGSCIRSEPHPLVKAKISGYNIKNTANGYLIETFRRNSKRVTLRQHLCMYYMLEYLFEVHNIHKYEYLPAAVKHLKSISSVAPFLIDSIIYTIYHTPMSHDLSVPITDQNNSYNRSKQQ